MAANRGAVDHVLPIIGQAEIDQRLKQSIPDALFGPASEPETDRVSVAVTLVHVTLGATYPQHVKHTAE